MVRSLYNWFMYPPRIAAIRRYLPAARPRILDIGCGNHSPRITKTYLPACEYHGVDDRRWNLDAEDDRCLDRFFGVSLERPDDLAAVPAAAYDAVILSHVLEHVSDPAAVLRRAASKVRAGGVIYVEVPAERSLRLPKARDGWLGIRGCLNFGDDPTHKTFVQLDEVVRVLRECGFDIVRRGRRRLWRRVALLPLYLVAVLAAKGFIPASLVWDVAGFADAVTARQAKD
jgi:2-polyprenyl-3-methyl-5-hydroxy-6-metoxy-1,4-benzoquinol methylase